jgi:cobalt-zinc-cadmium efflux system protein
MHAHDHQHHHSSPPVASDSRHRRLLLAFALTLVTLVVEAAGGWWSGSLALLADAGHMLVDALALLLAFLGVVFAQRPADRRRTFGYARLEVLAGYSNALVQFVLVGWIALEAIQRLLEPHRILSGVMLVVAIIGLVVNALVLQALHQHDHDDVNMAAASLHVLGDLLGSLGAVLAALAVRWLGWLWADPVLSLLVSALILRSAWVLLRRSGHILLEGVPEDIDPEEITRHLSTLGGDIDNVHHVHVWQLASGSRMATLHARPGAGADPERVIERIRQVMRERYRVDHVTVQVDPGACPDAAGVCDVRHGHG